MSGNIRDLMTAEDALEMEERYESAIQDHKGYEDDLGDAFREVHHRAVFDWEFDLPDDFFL